MSVIMSTLFMLIGMAATVIMLVKFGMWMGKNHSKVRTYINQYTAEVV